jgi:ferritin-like protein
MASEGLHEAAELLDEETVDHHRAMTSLCEELEAIDWYDQRVKATSDASLAAVLAHNRDEEKEHASMTLEWLRRRDPVLDRHLRTYLFRTEPITEIEADAEAGAGPGGGAVEPGAGEASGSLGIGSLKGHGS